MRTDDIPRYRPLTVVLDVSLVLVCAGYGAILYRYFNGGW